MNSGPASARSRSIEKRSVAVMVVSIAAMHTSPSPCAAWPSPAEKSAPSSATGDRSGQRVALHSARLHVGRGHAASEVTVRRVAALQHDRVAGIDGELRRDRVIPRVVDDIAIERVRARHGRGAYRTRFFITEASAQEPLNQAESDCEWKS